MAVESKIGGALACGLFSDVVGSAEPGELDGGVQQYCFAFWVQWISLGPGESVGGCTFCFAFDLFHLNNNEPASMNLNSSFTLPNRK